MEYKKQKLSEILNEFKKDNSGIILGNGFCTWLYYARDEAVRKNFQKWDLKEIIDESSDLFFTQVNKDIKDIAEESENNVDEIFFCIKEKFNQDWANKWLICFLTIILSKVNHTGLKTSRNLIKLYSVFKEIEFFFTTNYDPSFYWTIMKIKNKWPTRSFKETTISPRGGRNPSFDDGFFPVEDKLKFDEKSNCKVFYLHGAIFFKKEILKGLGIEKISRKNTKKDIIKVCEEYLESCLKINEKELPLLAVIGKNKENDIQKNNYLKHSLDKLVNCNKIITFGLSFSEDLHLLKNIINKCKENNEEKYLYIGCYDINEDKNSNPRFNFESYFKNNIKPNNLKIIFYDSKDIDDLNI